MRQQNVVVFISGKSKRIAHEIARGLDGGVCKAVVWDGRLWGHLDPPVCLCFCTATVASAFQITLYQIGGSFAFGGKTCEHANARGALRRKRVLACLQVVCRLCQLSKNNSSPLSEKKPFYIIPDPIVCP